MVHAIKAYRKGAGEIGISWCNKKLDMDEDFSMELEEVTCPSCRKTLITALLLRIKKRISLLTQLGLMDEVELLQIKKKIYESMIE